MRNYLSLHIIKLLAFIVSSAATLGLFIWQYALKPMAEINPWDVVGEGALVFVFGVWIVVILLTRPKGFVTNTLFAGLLLIYIGALWDFLDEFFRIDHHHMFMKVLESLPSLVGVIVLTGGLYWWKREQDYFNVSRTKKEKHFRDHDSYDVLTGLNNAKYMEDYMNYQIESVPLVHDSTIFVFDLQIKEYAPDHMMPAQILKDLVKVLEMSIRSDDLICRYSGQRFLIYFDKTDESFARSCRQKIQSTLEGLTYNYNGEDLKFLLSGKLYSIRSLIDSNSEIQSLLRHLIKLHNQGEH